MDTLSRLFGSLRVERALCTRFEATAPWGHQVTHRGQIKLVLVIEGAAWLRTRALREPTLLGADDLFFVLSSEPYTLSSTPQGAVVDCADLELLRDGYVIRYGGGGARTVLLSVALDVDPSATEALLLALPPFVHLRVEQNRSHKLQSLIDLLRLEVSAAETGSLPIVRRLAEALFLSTIRAYLQNPDGPRHGLLAALADAQLVRPLDQMHADVARPWTLEDLARTAHMSRSSFAAKFRSTVGETPLDYLASLRMERARALLREGVPMAEIAGQVGYESAVSFTRAFRRVTGRTPGAYKREVAVGG
jgi:AraC-like DNA-binding protein